MTEEDLNYIHAEIREELLALQILPHDEDNSPEPEEDQISKIFEDYTVYDC